MYMLCTNCGSGQSVDCAAQSMDPSFAQEIQGLYNTCAILGKRNLTLTCSVGYVLLALLQGCAVRFFNLQTEDLCHPPQG